MKFTVTLSISMAMPSMAHTHKNEETELKSDLHPKNNKMNQFEFFLCLILFSFSLSTFSCNMYTHEINWQKKLNCNVWHSQHAKTYDHLYEFRIISLNNDFFVQQNGQKSIFYWINLKWKSLQVAANNGSKSLKKGRLRRSGNGQNWRPFNGLTISNWIEQEKKKQ